MAHALQVTAREAKGKSAARKARRQGLVPGVVYGKHLGNVPILVNSAQLQRLLQSGGAGGLVSLEIGGKTHVAVIKEVQTDRVTGRNLHVDFQAVSLDEEVLVTVPVVLVGEEVRGNDGGIVTQVLRELPVHCMPAAIPERLEVDVSRLKIGDSVTVGEIALPAGVRLAHDSPETVVVSILAPSAARAPEGEAEGA